MWLSNTGRHAKATRERGIMLNTKIMDVLCMIVRSEVCHSPGIDFVSWPLWKPFLSRPCPFLCL